MDGSSVSSALLDFVELSRWQRLQDHFASVLGIAIRTVSPSHELLTTPSWPPSLSPDRAIDGLKIGDELESLIRPQELPEYVTTLTTRLGVTYGAVPIRATSDHIVGYFVVGPMVVGVRENEAQFRERMRALGQDPHALWPTILSLKLYTFGGIRSVLNLMEEVGTSLVQFAYQARHLAAILPSSSRVDQAVTRYYTDRVLQSLLEAATIATKADGGSVMVYDAAEDALQIKAAEGLRDDLIDRVRIKRGEGIAGVAFAERKVFLVDEQTEDARITSSMRRPELTSSIVAPFSADADRDTPVGVLNLRTTKMDTRFTSEHVELLRRLLDLTGAALGSLRIALH